MRYDVDLRRHQGRRCHRGLRAAREAARLVAVIFRDVRNDPCRAGNVRCLLGPPSRSAVWNGAAREALRGYARCLLGPPSRSAVLSGVTGRSGQGSRSGGPGQVLRLAVPALGVLLAEPVYLLFDTAVVGRLGAQALAGLAIGGLVLTQVSTQLTFLSYGTTSRAARFFGAGDRAAAVREGVQASWLAVGIGVLLTVAGEALAGPVTRVLAGSSGSADGAESWLRLALLGVVPMLLGVAGNGWLRGVQDTVRPLRYVLVGVVISAVLCPMLVHGVGGAPRLGLPGSALANCTGQVVAAGLFVTALLREHASPRPRPSVLRAQLVLARDLIGRSLAFQLCFVSAGAVAARFGAAAVAAHQMVLQLWTFVSLALDSLAIAAQSLVGAALGAGRTAAARALAWRVTRWSTVFAVVLAAAFAAGSAAVPRLFTPDRDVLAHTHTIWWFFVALVPVAGVVFALDGVLLGAGDAAYLRTTTLAAAMLGFLPAVWLSLAFRWGLTGIWTGLSLFIAGRCAAVVFRARSTAWSQTSRTTHELR
ncbi:MAG: MATE family efflux transporter [Mycobacteriaceae bacterium]|nr:MATE family efflux transporter [Mycobacteriaceae bacterium]